MQVDKAMRLYDAAEEVAEGLVIRAENPLRQISRDRYGTDSYHMLAKVAGDVFRTLARGYVRLVKNEPV